jgi:hypothetical protein
MTIPGISNWFEWTWPIEGEDAGYIKARAIANVGDWISFSPAQIQKFAKGKINQPLPQVSESTEQKSPWKIPIPHASGKVTILDSRKIFYQQIIFFANKSLDSLTYHAYFTFFYVKTPIYP